MEPKRKYRIMQDFEIHEISAVDSPAQEGARAAIMKRAQTKNFEYAKPLLLSEEKGHTHILDDIGNGGETSWSRIPGEDGGHTHPWVRNADGGIDIGAADGHGHTVSLSKESGGAAEPKPKDIQKMETEKKTEDGGAELLQAQVTELTKRAERAEKVAELSDEQKAHMGTLEKDGQDAFLSLSADDREAVIAKTREADPVVYTTDDGVELRKSAGDQLVSMAKKLDAQNRKLEKAEQLAKRQDLEKRAAAFENLPGELTAKVALLEAVDGIEDEGVRKSVLEILKADDAGLAKAFEEHGTTEAPDAGDAEAQLETLAKKISVDQKVSLAKGWELAAQTPEGRALYAQIAG